MENRKDILLRTYLVFIGIGIFCLFVLGKAIIIQTKEGKYWKAMSDSAHLRYEVIESERGTIYSEDGQMLSTSVPEFDIYVDFMADGLRDKNGALFKKYIDSLAIGLADLFNDKSAADYRKELLNNYKGKKRYALLKRKISYVQHEDLKKLPLVKLGKNKSGFISVVRMKRLYPFELMAKRTIGLARDSNKVGLEKHYDGSLSGTSGSRLVRYIAGGAGVPVEGTEMDPSDGSDLMTTLDVGIQEAAQNALNKMMVGNEAERGTCIVMEVKTGKVKAIANLGKISEGVYAENFNYAIQLSEPGSTFKLVTILSVLEDKLATLNTPVNLEGGRWNIAGQTVFDSEIHGLHQSNLKVAFERSSNVGMAKLVYNYYYNQPGRFIKHIQKLHLDSLTGIDIPGEGKPRIYKPGTNHWSKTTLPWMSFGYNLTVTPMHTAMLYNAVANNGVMVRPYLVNAIVKDGEVLKKFDPYVLDSSISSKQTIADLKECLEGVVLNGTAKSLASKDYSFAAKTGTALVADKGITYKDKMYQSSFAGYFPANDPQYTIVVVIRNKKHAAKFYGGSVAGPVFRDVADQIYATHIRKQLQKNFDGEDSAKYVASATVNTLAGVFSNLKYGNNDSNVSVLADVQISKGKNPELHKRNRNKGLMPSLIGLGLKDALAICEENQLKVTFSGAGKVREQSVDAGVNLKTTNNIHLVLR